MTLPSSLAKEQNTVAIRQGKLYRSEKFIAKKLCAQNGRSRKTDNILVKDSVRRIEDPPAC